MSDILDRVISINPEGDPSIDADKKVFHLYALSVKNNGRLVAFNELKTFSKNLHKEREKALSKIRENEKWFKKGIEFLDEWKRPYKVGEPTEEDKEKIKELVESYPKLYDNILDEYNMRGSFSLLSMLSFIDENRAFFKKVKTVSMLKKAQELYEAILLFDFIHLLHERSKDLVQLILARGLTGNIKEGDFIRTATEIKKQKNKKPGPDTPEQLKEDIRSIIKEVKGDSEYLYRGSLNIKKTVEYALSKRKFYKKWVDEESAIENEGYTKRQLQTLFTRENKR